MTISSSLTPSALMLDVKSLPGGNVFKIGNSKETLDMGALFDFQLREAINNMMHLGLIRVNGSFGFAMARPGFSFSARDWDNPAELVWMTAGWGPNKVRYIANAVRMLRLTARTGRETLGIHSTYVDSPVESVASDGTYRWGDYPHGGAVVLVDGFIFGGYKLLGAVDGLTEEQNHMIATLIMSFIDLEIKELKKNLAKA